MGRLSNAEFGLRNAEWEKIDGELLEFRMRSAECEKIESHAEIMEKIRG